MTNAIINDTMGVIDSITGGVTSVIGDVMGFVDDLISFLTCGGMKDTECTKVNEWSIKGGPGSKGGKSNISSMIGKVKNISSTVSNVGSNVSSSLTSLKDIDFTGVLASSQCDLGPRTCGPPTVEYIGLGQGSFRLISWSPLVVRSLVVLSLVLVLDLFLVSHTSKCMMIVVQVDRVDHQTCVWSCSTYSTSWY